MPVELTLELPFYSPEALEAALAPILASARTGALPSDLLDDKRVAEAVNAALRLTIQSRDDTRA